jgi:hypothetical protein
MAWQTNTVNPATTTPAVDITKITNDLQQLRSVIGGGTDTDIPVGLAVAMTNNLVGATIGSIWYQSALNTTAQLAVGTGGQVLQSGGTGAPPTWTSAPDFTTQAPGNNTTKAATTAFVTNAVNNLSTGSYTPTVTSVANAASLSASLSRWSRIGNTVYVDAWISFQPVSTGTTTTTQINISLPIASNLSGSFDVIGHAIAVSQTIAVATISQAAAGVPARFYMPGTPAGLAGVPATWLCRFMYQIN